MDSIIINFRNLNIYHKDGDTVLRGVNFQVKEGEFIYLIGRVGSGKSSLLKTIYCELDTDEADEATVLNVNLLTIRRKQIPGLRRRMGIIFQDFQLLGDRTVYMNLHFVLKATGWSENNRIDQRIDEVLQQVGMENMKERMPHELSGGEQQRIAIARALLNSPRLIVADEPTGNLDPETADAIISLLRDISKHGTAVVLTTHNRQLLDWYPGKVYRCVNSRLEDVTNAYKQVVTDEELQE